MGVVTEGGRKRRVLRNGDEQESHNFLKKPGPLDKHNILGTWTKHIARSRKQEVRSKNLQAKGM